MSGNEWITHEIKRRLILRSKGVCYHCKKKAVNAMVDGRGLPSLYDEKGRKFHIDHLKPLCIGGENKEDNLVVSCRDCNQKKQRQNLRHKEEVDKFLEMVNSRAKKD
ncbi:HNH endonuclease [Candidatus Woesearchaeota archaeon]|nr:HNH endonuclease [Candidatus Woesearchaeota archaeon]